MIAKYDYNAAGPQELSLKKNEKLRLIDDSMHWWKVLNSKNQTGFVPSECAERGSRFENRFDSLTDFSLLPTTQAIS